MKSQIIKLFIFSFFALIMVTSCEDEQVDVNDPNAEELITPNSSLTSLMSNTVANYGAYDNVLDNSDCFSVELPVTVIVSGVTITIESAEDIDDLEDLMEELNFEEEIPEFLFPITIIFNDYTEVTIENQDQFNAFINNCGEEEEVIECVDFQYPISFSVFNSTFDIIDTVIIQNDEALYNFLDSLEDDDSALIVSLNFPVTLEFANGENLEVNSNQELADAIASAQDDCDGNGEECSEEFLNQALLECRWSINDENDDFDNYDIIFNQNGSLVIIEGEGIDAIDGNWNVEQTDEGLFLTFSELTAFQGDLGGEWLIVECDDDEIEIVKDGFTIELQKNCMVNNQDLLQCYSLYILSQECDDNGDGLANFVFETNVPQTEECLSLYPLAATTHPTHQDALNNTNLLNIGVTDPIELESQTLYVRVYSETTQEFAIQELEVVVESCNEAVFDCFGVFELVECANSAGEAIFNLSADTIGNILCEEPFTASFHVSETNAQANINPIENTESYGSVTGEVYLRVEASSGAFQIFPVFLNANDCNLFECFESFDAVLELCDELGDGTETFNLENAFANCTPSADLVTYHINQSDAETGSNAIPNPQAFNNTNSPQVIYVRVEINGQFEVFPIELIVSNCDSGSCTEEELYGIFLECEWNITSFNGSDNLVEWNFDFESSINNVVIIYTSTETIDATWTTSQTSEGVIVEFSNVNGPNIQEISGAWLVVECNTEQLVLQGLNNTENQMQFDRNCD